MHFDTLNWLINQYPIIFNYSRKLELLFNLKGVKYKFDTFSSGSIGRVWVIVGPLFFLALSL